MLQVPGVSPVTGAFNQQQQQQAEVAGQVHTPLEEASSPVRAAGSSSGVDIRALLTNGGGLSTCAMLSRLAALHGAPSMVCVRLLHWPPLWTCR